MIQLGHKACFFRGVHTTPQRQSTFATSNLKAQCCFKIRRRTTEPELPGASAILFLLLLIICCALSQMTRGVQANEAESPTSRPRITIQPNDLVAIEGESAELNCDAEGEPEPTIEWYHNGQLIRSSTNSRTTMGGSIQFLDIRPPIDSGAGSGPKPDQQQQQQPSDAGVYHCLAKNQFGQERSRNATLQVAYIKEQFKVAPRDKMAAQGDTVTFDCLPQAWPEPRIQWRRNGRPIDPQELPTLADGSAKYSISKVARADLNSNNNEVLAPQRPNAAAEAGTNEANANEPLGKVAKLSSGTESPMQRQTGELVDLFGSRLVIKQADKGDEAKYSCLVETKGSHRLIERESPAGQLSTFVKPYFIEAPAAHKSAQVGEQVRMRCRMGGEPDPVISWRRQNGQPLSDKTMIDSADKTLIIDGLRVADQGVYICEGENAIGSAKAMAQVSVNSRPKFIQQPLDQSAEIGSQVQLKCSGEANPTPMLFWYKEGHRQLMFPQQQQQQQQQQPTTGQQNHHHRSPSNQQLKQPPWPQADPLSMSPSTIQTTSDTSPAINRLFSMPIGGEHLTPNSNYFANRIYVDNQGTLNIINVTASDTGYYACALVSSLGSVMAKAKLTVKQSPFSPILSDPFAPGAAAAAAAAAAQDPLQARMGALSPFTGKYDLLPPPVIKMGSSNQTLPTNTSVTLLCEVVSQVAYKIQWFFDSQPLQEDPPRLTVLENGNLFINNLRISDSGTYTCAVTAAEEPNMALAHPFEPLEASMLTSAPPTYQSTAHSCYLKIAAPTTFHIALYKEDTYAYPSSPGAPYMLSTNGEDAITIQWAPPGDSGKLPVKQYVVEHYDTSQESLGWRVIHRLYGKETLLIDGLSSEGSHFFVVRATNGRGTGPSSAIAGPMRTMAGEHRYQLEQQRRRNPTGSEFADTRPDINSARDRLATVQTHLLSLTPVSSTSIKLQWSTQSSGNTSYLPFNSLALGDYLEGFSIRYRAIGSGESLLGSFFGLTQKNQFDSKIPASLPLVTTYVEEDETLAIAQHRSKREVTTNYYDYSPEFNEARVTDQNAEHFTIKDLRPFTAYQFFVVPYYKEIDGVPSNLLTTQTSEDRPDVAPSVMSFTPIDNTTIRLIWSHIPPVYANGIIRGYLIRINQTDILTMQPMTSSPRVISVPMSVLNVAPLTSVYTESRFQPVVNGMRQSVIMYDVTNLTHKSFYSIQVAGLTNVGPGPWSEARNFLMDPEKMADLIKSASDNELDEIGPGAFLSRIPNSLDNSSRASQNYTNVYVVLPVILIVVSVILLAGFVYYRRNNQQVITWKKTISEHFTNKFYLPSAVDHHDHNQGPGSLQQNIYDHQHHLIYSAGSTHMTHHHLQQQQPMLNQTMRPVISSDNNGQPGSRLISSGTGSLSSHGGLLPISSDPNSLRARNINEQQALMMNNTNVAGASATMARDINSQQQQQRYMRTMAANNGGPPHYQMGAELARSMNQQQQQQQQNRMIYHGDVYYSVVNNQADYEELDQHQQQHRHNNSNGNNMQIAGNPNFVVDRHQSSGPGSNSDTSCPSSVTRLLPNQNYNRSAFEQLQQQRHEMILQQQVGYDGDSRRPIITMINGSDYGKYQQQNSVPLSSYVTTNLK